MSLLQVQDLSVAYGPRKAPQRVVDSVSFDLAPGTALGIVGESGSGKSQTALALMGLLAGNAQLGGSIRFEDQELVGLKLRAFNRLRGANIGMVFQDPMTSLNPHLNIGTQMAEVLQRHRSAGHRAALTASAEMLEAVQLADAGAALKRYPHQFSGGMRQRICVAMALLCRPKLLIADEPTTALDVTVQAQILRLLAALRRDMGLSLILISHDIGVISELCDHSLVMYGGRVMESGSTVRLLTQPAHPYTVGLLASRPHLHLPRSVSLRSIPGQPPMTSGNIDGCPFHPRCASAYASCTRVRPPPHRSSGGTLSACHLET